LRQNFNIRKKKEVNNLILDKFLNIDIITGVSTAFLFWTISLLDINTLVEPLQKNLVDYMVAVIFILIWAKPFMLLLVIPSISKMLQTLVFMLIDVKAFMVLCLIYIFAMT